MNKHTHSTWLDYGLCRHGNGDVLCGSEELASVQCSSVSKQIFRVTFIDRLLIYHISHSHTHTYTVTFCTIQLVYTSMQKSASPEL